MLEKLYNNEKILLNNLEIDFKRYLYEKIDFSSQMVAIVGARGVGKTTLLLQKLQELRQNTPLHHSLYFSFDLPFVATLDLFEFAGEFTKQGGRYLLIDEIHKYKNFAIHLKAIYDVYPDLKVLFTGSCATSILNAQADLSRRVVTHRLYGLSYREFLELTTNQSLPKYFLKEMLENKTEIVDDLMGKFRPLEHWNEYLEHGYYPFYFSERKHFLELLYNTINLTIEVDLLNLGLIKMESIEKLKKLLLVICQSDPFKINISKIATLSELSRNSIYSYLNHLDKGELLNIVMNSKKGLAILAKPDKVYLNNTNQLFAMCTEHKIGTVRETFFANQVGNMHSITSSDSGDFIVDGKYTFEVGGKNKSFNQIKDIPNSYLVIDDDFSMNEKKIPLWLFGFLY
ncbi:MAG: ATPase component BioM of energizing module of biotin ECF transporter [uncultured Sulfurovum sp.]|uniref:ATPase component BioM of energizing module of biotin ECF transporter n=1 Tax=uncultured Sulfurovum sp. TaxID=269237 RepID=A0A6S6TYA5_9BACT|nr:MAG: ATPase component BioM of energizing module of biotin ECF transporter [uncultured Sulfurovum sp.]